MRTHWLPLPILRSRLALFAANLSPALAGTILMWMRHSFILLSSRLCTIRTNISKNRNLHHALPTRLSEVGHIMPFLCDSHYQ